MKRTRLIFTSLALVLLFFATTQAADTSPDKATVERLETLEKTVIRDPFQPKTTVLARLDAIEATLKAMAKAGDTGEKTDLQKDQQLKRDLETLQKTIVDFDKRLKTLESAKPDPNGADIRDLKRTTEQLTRTLDDLKERIKKLESKR